MRFIKILLLTLAVPLVSPAQINSLQDLLNYADEHSADARQAQLIPQMARQDVNMQASNLYPRVNVFAAGDYYPLIPTQLIPAEILGGAPGTYYKAQFGLPYVFQAGAELSIPVVDLEKWAQLKRVRNQYEQAQWTSKVAIERLHLQLVQSYYQLLATKEVAKLNDENIETVNELVRIMADRKEAGILEPADYNRVLNLKLNTETSGISYTGNIQQITNSVIAILGVRPDEKLAIGGSLMEFEWSVLAQPGALSSRPAWYEAEKKLKVAELALSESRKGALPKLNLNSRYVYNMQSRFESGSKSVDFPTANVGLRLDFPVFRGNYYNTLQKKSKLQLQSAQLEKERVEANLGQQQKDWFNSYSTAYAKHTLIEQKVKNASDNLRIARLNIKEGLMEFDEFNNIFVEYNRAKMEYFQNLTDGILYYLLSTQNF